MKNKHIFYGILLTLVFMSGCSTKSVFYAPNGKTYYVDLEECHQYHLKRDVLFCDNSEDTGLEKIYYPTKFGYKIETRKSY